MTTAALTTRCVADDARCTCGTDHGDHHLADHPFDLAPGEDPTCTAVENCKGCGATMCPDHDSRDLVAECVDGGVHHADPDDCAVGCWACVADARDELASERAEARRDADAWGW